MIDRETMDKFYQPFDDDLIQFKVQSINGDAAIMVAYVDARDVINRLNESGLPWSDEYEVNATHNGFWAKCRLTVADEVREGVGIGDDPKAAESDALKRAALKFGIGMHLWKSHSVKVPWDSITKKPKITRQEILSLWKEGKAGANPFDQIEEVGAEPSQHSPPSSPPVKKPSGYATAKQVGFIKKLIGEKFNNPGEVYQAILDHYGVTDETKIPFDAARETIDHLLGKQKSETLHELLAIVGD